MPNIVLNNSTTPRIETLDWLRGLMALSIMFYHLALPFSSLNSSDPLGRLSIYAVSIFFILSGLCMAIVYNNYIKNIITSLKFFVRRVFRIAPLLWLVIAITLPPALVVHAPGFELPRLILNVTLLFGFINPAAFIAAGSWSIGNELVYYALTPLIILLFNFKKQLGNLLFFITLVIGLFFSFRLLDPGLNLAEQWGIYVNPFNNLFLYVMGVAMYYNLKDLRISKKANMILLLAAAILFCFLPFKGDEISIITGFGRVVFVLLSFVIVLCFYKMEINLPKSVKNWLTGFGLITYGVYLYHPVIIIYLDFILKKIIGITGATPRYILLLFLVPIVTYFVAKYSYKYFESKLVKFGKKLTAAKTGTVLPSFDKTIV